MDLEQYRPNVGIVLFNPEGLVWLGRRVGLNGPYHWQFPQGGIDDGEEVETAARRELAEETGVTQIAFLGRTHEWLTYDFPPDLAARGFRIARHYRGQRQRWFALRFTGTDADIRLDADPHPEFDAWRWAPLAELPALAVPFKRPIYDAIARDFARFAVAV